jgi:GNAT superfamily N-acetyltransferase
VHLPPAACPHARLGDAVVACHLERPVIADHTVCADGGCVVCHARYCTVRMLATHPAFRRRGWCRVLHACIQQWAAQHNIPRVTAEVAMEAVAMTVWRQFGFTKPNVGELHHPPLFQKTLFMCRDTDTTVRDLGYYDSGVADSYRALKLGVKLGSTPTTQHAAAPPR